jgi:Dyp-type peroxidase family
MAQTLELNDIQGIVIRGYGNLRAASYVLFRIDDPAAARNWLQVLANTVTTGDTRPEDTSVNIAFTSSGLRALGLAPETMAMFSQEFVDGMTTPYRRRMLGDLGSNAPEKWMWGGPTTDGVDLVLLLYARDGTKLTSLYDSQLTSSAGQGLHHIATLETVDLGDKEHFGFHDGISQPLIEGLPKSVTPADTVKAGEFILGYPNEYGLYTDRPIVPPNLDRQNRLPADAGGSGNRDLGRNGSYLVFRQLRQDVPGFRRFLDEASRNADGSHNPAECTRLAAKMVGRWQSGAPLVLAPEEDNPKLANENNFSYFRPDAQGYKCPVGAHIRRSNPRDSLDPRPGSNRSIALNKRHRLLRRGREYGNPVSATTPQLPASPDEERGLHFICLSGNLARQFEFVQHTWVNNPTFHGLYDDTDPIIGSHAEVGSTFTVQARPVRRQYTALPDFVSVRGGAYFFVPGMRALRYLSSIDGRDRA